ncbi:MAG TPA: hypothetical protein VHI52_10620, partial [Verrucomicrobiae bacterium]|nr:hypothetical protein [Verrucomicrobiae bacterium]
VVGYFLVVTTKTIIKKVTKDEVIVPDAALAQQGPPGGIVNPGLGADKDRRAEQNIDDSVSKSDGWSMKKGEALQASLAGGGAADNEGDTTIGIGPNSAFGKGKGSGSGSGNNFGMGEGDDSGVLAPFGTPGGGGGIGPKAPFAGLGGNAHKIVYLCDASGSMLTVFPDLKSELQKSVSGLVQSQFFNVIFFPEGDPVVFSPGGLCIASANHKNQLYDFVSRMSPQGETQLDQVAKAFKLALDNKPELIYVLTDGFETIGGGDAAKEIGDLINKENPDHSVKINTIMLSDDPNRDKSIIQILQRIAEDNGGKWKVIDKGKF